MIMYEPPVGGSIFVAWLRGRFDAYYLTLTNMQTVQKATK